MASATKFGTFGGVFTPSVLTILGVIMYLRLPWVVGNAGLWMTLGIIVAAHVISFTTGLSISSIATDKKVGAGGPYYIVSRSMGLPIGGTLGLALFIGLSFSISLYVIGFCESLLQTINPYTGIEITKNAVRVAGTITVVALTSITLISSAFAIKIQYVIMVLIGASLVSIFFGSPIAPVEAPVLGTPDGGEPITYIFGVFFPAVTGFTAGVNMSGDLKDPKRALPRGTMAAIFVGLIAYIALAAFLAFRVDGENLRNNQTILQEIAIFGPAVIAGIWGATLSSGIGSIMGAPRILQALSNDGVTPRFFGKGRGPSNEPVRALILAFAIGEAGILIGELDVIAAIVSMFFIATYGFLNLSAAIESWASTDFRPDFPIPRAVSIVGAITCFVIMIYLDLAAMMGATALFVVCFFVLKRRELTLSSGDTWEGVWSSLVRLGLNHLARAEDKDAHRWRPNVLALRTAGIAERSDILDFGQVLIRDRGVLTDLALGVSDLSEARAREELDGVFHRAVDKTGDAFDEMLAAVRFSGFRGVEPNTVLMDWREHAHDPAAFLPFTDKLSRRELNLLLFSPGTPRAPADDALRVDVWWHPQRDASALAMSLVRYLTSSHEFASADVRFLFVNDDNTRADLLIRTTTRLLEAARVTARVQVLDNSFEDKPLEHWVARESADASMTIMALPHNEDELARTSSLIGDLGPTLLLRGAREFRSSFGGGALARLAVRSVTPTPAQDTNVPEDAVARADVFAGAPEAVVDAIRPVALGYEETLQVFHAECLKPLYVRLAGVTERFSALVMKELGQLEKNLEKSPSPKHPKLLSVTRGRFLHQAKKTLHTYEREDLPVLHNILESQVEAVIEQLSTLTNELPKSITLSFGPDDYAADPDDDKRLRRAKRRLRMRAGLFSKKAKQKVNMARLLEVGVDQQARELVFDAVAEATRDAYNATRHMGRTLEALRRDLAELAAKADGGLDIELVSERKEAALASLRRVADAHFESARLSQGGLLTQCDMITAALVAGATRLDAPAHIKALYKQLPANEAKFTSGLNAAPTAFLENQSALLRRVELQLVQAALQHRVRTVALKASDRIKQSIKTGVEAEYARLVDTLATLEARGDDAINDDEESEAEFRVTADIKVTTQAKGLIEELGRDIERAIEGDLMSEAETASDEAILNMEESPFDVAERVNIPIGRATRALLESELLGPLESTLNRLRAEEERAIGTAQDVSRLLSFHLSRDARDADDEAPANEETVVKNARDRLQTGQDRLHDAAKGVDNLVHDGLRRVEGGVDALVHSGDERALRRGSAAVPRSRARARLAGYYETGRERLSRTVVNGLYRWSTGRVLSRQMQRSTADSGAERVLPLVDACTPSDMVLTQLPFHYQQPFMSSARAGADFFVGRTKEIASAQAAIAAWKKGARGALLVVGERQSGKSALCRAILRKHLPKSPVVHVTPPAGGATTAATFDARVRAETGRRGDIDDIMSSFDEGTCVVLHDIEMWWTRAENGEAVIDHILSLIARYGDTCFFVINVGRHAYRLLGRITRLPERALSVVECGPLDAETLKDAIIQRHRTTGFAFEYNGRREADISQWARARLFTRVFDYAEGRIGAALLGWIAHIDKVSGSRIVMKNPRPVSTDALDELGTELVALTVELVLHRQMSRPRLLEVTRMKPAGLNAALGTLLRSGLVIETDRGALELNRFADHLLTRHLIAQGVLQ